MTEQQQQPQDGAGTGDAVSVNQPNPDLSLNAEGQLVYPEEVSPPDPRFWGDDADRPDPFAYEGVASEGAGGVPPDTISKEGVSGPDSRWWTKEIDENGVEVYVGRDDLNYLNEPPPVTDLREGGTEGA